MSSPDSTHVPACFSTIIEHHHFNTCLDRLRELVRMNTSTRIVLVTGPTGIGKTTLLEGFLRELEALSAEERKNDPEMVAYGVCAVSSRGQTAFSWKDTYLQTLKSLHHPFSEQNMMPRAKLEPTDSGQVLKAISHEKAQRIPSDRLFRIVQKTIMHRKPKAIIFDEAHHLLRVASSQSLVNQLEHLKYIADETRTLNVLFGTYELIQLMDLSSALIRRREVIHFPRYIYDNDARVESLEEFAKVVAVFARDLDPLSDFALLSDVPNLYQGSVGCVGILRNWLYRAYLRSREKSTKITRSLLKETIMASSDRLALIETAQEGEKYFVARDSCETKYLAALGFSAVQNTAEENAKPKGRGKGKPFERNPHNDRAGLGNLDPSKQGKAA